MTKTEVVGLVTSTPGVEAEAEQKPVTESAVFAAGILVIDKPIGSTSFKMVSGVRRALGIKKVGHAGTLDPFASGLLVVCVGRAATRLVPRMMAGQKEYLATLCLGVETESFDPEGAVVARQPVGEVSAERIEACLAHFRGQQLQVPPIFSALKYHGKPLYHYARQGISIVKEPRPVFIQTLERTDGGGDLAGGETAELSLRVVCSKGTYIRSLAADIGKRLGCGAHLTGLRRLRSGCFSLQHSFPGQELWSADVRQRLLATALSVDDIVHLL